MARIVLSTLGTLGDHVPFVALGLALRARGHDVVVAVNDAARLLFERVGLTVVRCGTTYGAEQARSHPELYDEWRTKPARQRATLLRRSFDLGANYRALLPVCRKAELLVAVSLQLAAPRVHDALGIPWVAVSLMPGELLQAAMDGSAEAVRRHRPRRPLEPLPGGLLFLEYLRAARILLASSPHFSPCPADAFPALRATGFWFYDGAGQEQWRPTAEVEDFVSERPGPVVLSLGSLPVRDAASVVAVHARATARMGLRLLVQRGWANLDDSQLPPEVDRRDVRVTGALPHDWLLARASAVVHHGGIGTTARALRNGCPMIIEPHGRDQLFNAGRIVALRAGLAMHPHKLSAEGLHQALERVLGAPVRRRVAELGAAVSAEQGLEQACLHIEEVLLETHTGRRARLSRP
ncbi:MAG: glycosyltransferase family 1 protein [Myxococcaceae bacterium]|nr:glycosyltransferase family 1 protein [Myxococcaceae bacterium]